MEEDIKQGQVYEMMARYHTYSHVPLYINNGFLVFFFVLSLMFRSVINLPPPLQRLAFYAHQNEHVTFFTYPLDSCPQT